MDEHGTSGAAGAAALRPATAADLPAIVGLIRELAAYERLEHLVVATPESLAPHLFGPRPAAEVVLAEAELAGRPEVVGFALYFTNFSTFLAQPGLYLEDLYVQPAYRGRGLGKALLEHLGALAVARGCGRFEWAVLEWNESAIGFYERMGAKLLPDWRICRVTGAALAAFARPEPVAT
ncbi:MAG: putative acetyltransferase [Pseudomonadota bacterium]|jgi:GNAT superfamily N-acetyltransferase|nr:GNAT family N-acetyltransferase [Rubrivivax sp.]NLZ40894.1 GNAT family N-acetyltransferase [Comamonadaceae bacterium]